MLLLATKVWEQRQLGEIGTTYSGLSGKNKSDFEKGNSIFVTFLEVLNNPVLKNIDLTNKVEIKENEHQNKVKRNDILFNTSSETPEEVATSTVVDVNQDNLYLNSFCFGFRPNVQFSNYYIGYYLRSNHFRNRVFCLAQGISRYNISKKSLIKLKLSLPKLEEQDKISRIFNQIELLLTLYERKLKLLSKIKKYFLDNLFAEKEYPNLRFKKFTDAWEQRKLGEIGTTYSGLSGKNKSDFEKGNSNFVTFLEVLNNPVLKNIDLTNKVEIKENEHQNKVKRNDILFNTSSETPEEVATSTVVEVNQDNLYLNSFCFGFRPNIQFSNYYIGYYLRSNHFRSKVFCLAQGISRYNISKKSLIKLKLSLPKLEEQDKIGKIFNRLELLLNLYENKQQHLTKIKKTLLNTMFI